MKTMKTKAAKKAPRSPDKKAKRKRLAGAGPLLEIAARLKGRAEANVRLPRWDRAAATLFKKERNAKTPEEFTDTERLTLGQYIRDMVADGTERDDEMADRFGTDGAFYFIVRQAWDIVNANYDPALAKQRRAIDKIYGTKEDEDWPDMDDEKREDVRKLRIDFTNREDALLAAVLRKHEEDGLADMVLNDREAFYNKYDRGEAIWEKAQEKKGKVE